MGSFPPTAEQQAAIDCFQLGVDMKIEAYAGAGKTASLLMLAATTRDRGAYFAFNRSIVDEASKKFDTRRMDVRTIHSHAWRWRMIEWGGKRLNYRTREIGRQPAWQAARLLEVDPVVIDGKKLGDVHLTRLALEAVNNFCKSTDPDLDAKHVPTVMGLLGDAQRANLASVVLPYAQRAWADLSRPDGALRMGGEHYIKQWALSEPIIDADYILLDEAQDVMPAVTGVIAQQRGRAQIVLVGDSRQAINGWTGSGNFIAEFDVDPDAHLLLSQSWRFGQSIADEGWKWLRLLGADQRLLGNPGLDSMVAPIRAPGTDRLAVLTRTNAEAVSELMGYQDDSIKACITGGGEDFKKLAEAARELKEKGSTWHPEFAVFTSWGQVREYTEEQSGSDLKVAVDLIDEHGTDEIIAAIGRQTEAQYAQVIVSTAHKSKGLEFDRVRIGDDFTPPPRDKSGRLVMPSRADMMLAYVAVTRAQKILDPSGLDWVNDYIAILNAAERAAEEQVKATFNKVVGDEVKNLKQLVRDSAA